MSNKNFRTLAVSAMILLGISEVALQLHQAKWFSLPHEVYYLAYYLRVSVALACIFLGAFGVLLKKHKVVAPGKYLLIFVGVCFANFSILPSVTSLYFLKGIDIRLLDEDTLKSLNDHAGIQSEFLKNIAILFGIYGFGFLILVSRLFRRKGTT